MKEIQTYIKKLELQKIVLYLWRKLTNFLKMCIQILQILKILLICPASSTIVEHGFSLMNMQINKLGLLMKIWTLDALLQIYYEYDITDQDTDDIIRVWFKNKNRHTDLP